MGGEVDTTCRVTSLAVWHPGMKRTGSKKKRKEQEDVGEGSPKKKIKIDDASSKVMTPVDFKSIESNIFCLAASFSASVLYSSESAGAYPYALGKVAAASISLENEALLTSPSLLVSASTNSFKRE